MRLILLGPPGSGKGTQAQLLSQRLNLVHISTGDIFRDAIRRGTPAGQQAEPFVKSGKLVPDNLVNQLIADRFGRDDRPERFILDGYPRTLGQAVYFDQVLRQHALDLTEVVVLRVEQTEIINRLTGRWSCPKPGCGATYHPVNNPPRVAGICDRDGTSLVQRADDRVETVQERLRVYHTDTEGLIAHYQAQGLVREVSGQGGIEQIYANIVKAINHRAEPPC